MVSADKVWLNSIVPKVREFLASALGLAFHDGKLQITSIWHGAEFLGTWIKPRRIYASRSTVVRITAKLHKLARSSQSKWYAALNSYCGVLSHWNNYKLRRKLLLMERDFTRYGVFNMEYTKYNAAA